MFLLENMDEEDEVKEELMLTPMTHHFGKQ
jgi:hypothetical protein